MTTTSTEQRLLIEKLLNPSAYPHPVDKVRLIETHISWILLTGKFAYKLKKAVKLEFINASSLQRRLQFCFEELRLNSRLAPDLYLGVVEIIGPSESPKILDNEYKGARRLNNKAIEVAVKMIQFPGKSILYKQLRKGAIHNLSMRRLAEELASFHLTISKATPNGNLGTPHAVITPARKNLNILKELNLQKNDRSSLDKLQNWTEEESNRLWSRFSQRLHHGAIRECHGDLHAGNIHLTANDHLEVFDAIDFNPELRWIDPISEVAFLAMDLQFRQRQDLAMELLNHWLEQTGDYWGLDLWRWYSSYRALVRAKVKGLRIQQLRDQKTIYSLDTKEIDQLERDLNNYLKQALFLKKNHSNALILMHGLSGSGKSFVSERLCHRLPAIRLRSDLERQRAFGQSPLQVKLGSMYSQISSEQALPRFSLNKYAPEVNKWLFENLLPALAARCLDSGFTTIVDATFLKRKERDHFSNLARDRELPFAIVACECSEATARARLMQRASQGTDPSEADLNIRQQQSTWIESLTGIEQQMTVRVSETTPIRNCLQQLMEVLKR